MSKKRTKNGRRKVVDQRNKAVKMREMQKLQEEKLDFYAENSVLVTDSTLLGSMVLNVLQDLGYHIEEVGSPADMRIIRSAYVFNDFYDVLVDFIVESIRNNPDPEAREIEEVLSWELVELGVSQSLRENGYDAGNIFDEIYTINPEFLMDVSDPS